MASRRPTKKRRRATRGRALTDLLDFRMPQFEQHQLDVIGLGLVALAAYFTLVFYLGWDGGKVGEYMAIGFKYLFGGVAYLAPIVMFGTGAVLVLRPMLPSVKPFKAGATCLIVGLLLGSPPTRSASGRTCRLGRATSTPSTSATTAASSAMGSTGPRTRSSSSSARTSSSSSSCSAGCCS